MQSLEIASLIVSLIVGSGGLGCVLHYGTRLALLERTVETSQLNSLHPRLTLVESAVQEIKSSLQDLKLLPKISAQLEAMQESFRQMVPRHEHESRWKGIDNRFESLETDIRDLKT